MAAMTTALTEFANNGNSRTCTYTGHATSDPRLVIERRKVPAGLTSVGEYLFQVISGTEDSSSEPLQSRVMFEAKVRYPVNGASADVTAALAVFRDIVAGDEFTNSVSTQEWLT